MTNKVYGTYASEEQAITVIEGLELKGLKAENITIFTNHSKRDELKKRTDVNVLNNLPEPDGEKEQSVLEKAKGVFKKEPNANPDAYETLRGYGLSDEHTKKCIAEVESGNVIVIIDDEIRMGHPSKDNIIHQRTEKTY